MARKQVWRNYDVISIMMLIADFWKSLEKFKLLTCILGTIKFEVKSNILTGNGY